MIRHDQVVWFGLGILITILLFRSCLPDPIGSVEYIQGRTDTILTYKRDTVVRYKPMPYAVLATPETLILANTTASVDSIRVYRNVIDSGSVSIEVTDTVRGYLITQHIAYQIPTIHTHRTDTIRERCRPLPIALSGIYNLQDRSVTVQGQYLRDRTVVTGGYNLYNKSISIGYGIRF